MSNQPWSYTKEINETVDELHKRLMTNSNVKKSTWGPLPQITDLYPNYPNIEPTDPMTKSNGSDSHYGDCLLYASQAWATPTPIPPPPEPSWAQRAIPILSLIGILSFMTGQIALDIYILYSIFTKTLNLTELACLVFIHTALLLSAYLFKHTHYHDQSN